MMKIIIIIIIISSKAKKRCIIGVLKGRNRLSKSLTFGLNNNNNNNGYYTPQVEVTTIKTILNSNTVRWLDVTVKHKIYGNQEKVGDDLG